MSDLTEFAGALAVGFGSATAAGPIFDSPQVAGWLFMAVGTVMASGLISLGESE